MLTGNEGIVDGTQQSQHLIQELVTTRTTMLTLYSRLASCSAADEEVSELLQEFCEVLIDYTASAHFRLYRLIEEKKIDQWEAVLELAEKTYPSIARTTQTIIEFNDRYDSQELGENATRLEADLSQLGEQLAERIELEDQLIQVIYANVGAARKSSLS